MSSNDCVVSGSFTLKEGVTQKEVRVAMDSFLKAHDSDFNEQWNADAIDISDTDLSFSIDVQGRGGYRNEELEKLAENLADVVAGGAWLEFRDHDTTSEDEMCTPYFIGTADEKVLGRVKYGIEQMEPWVRPVIGNEAFELLCGEVLTLAKDAVSTSPMRRP